MSFNTAKKRKENSDDEDYEGDITMGEMNLEDMNQTITGEGPDIVSTSERWSRTDAPKLDATKDSLTFQQIDVEHYIGAPMWGMTEQVGAAPIIRMFGITASGNSVCCHVHGFYPYFYLAAPAAFKNEHCEQFRESLDKSVLADSRSNKENVNEAVLRVELVERINILGYQGDKAQRFIKITLSLPRFVAASARLLKNKIIMSEIDFQDCHAFESNIDYDIRFMVDNDVVGCNWIHLPSGRWNFKKTRESRCQYEVDVQYNDIVSHEPEGEWSKVAPFRILSFDLECAGRKGIFPEAKIDPVIQIANMVIRQGEAEPFIRNVFALNTCAPIVGSQVLCFDTETV